MGKPSVWWWKAESWDGTETQAEWSQQHCEESLSQHEITIES